MVPAVAVDGVGAVADPPGPLDVVYQRREVPVADKAVAVPPTQ